MRSKIAAYALEFTSFLLESGIEPRKVILFGSAVTGEFDRESDIDIFVDMNRTQEKNVRSALKMFESAFGEKWRLKGVSNPLSVKVGNLSNWHDLRRSIQSYGMLLYGKYSEFPENMKSYLLFRLDFSGMPRAKKVRMWRKLYGYAQRVGRKKYEKKGMVESMEGKKIERGVILVPVDKSQKLKEFLNKNRIGFQVNEIWSDSL